MVLPIMFGQLLSTGDGMSTRNKTIARRARIGNGDVDMSQLCVVHSL